MRGYQLLQDWRSLTPAQQDHCIQWFMGGVGMDYEGFADSDKKSSYFASVYTLSMFSQAITQARKIKPMEKKPLDTSYSRYCGICQRNRIHRSNSCGCCSDNECSKAFDNLDANGKAACLDRANRSTMQEEYEPTKQFAKISDGVVSQSDNANGPWEELNPYSDAPFTQKEPEPSKVQRVLFEGNFYAVGYDELKKFLGVPDRRFVQNMNPDVIKKLREEFRKEYNKAIDPAVGESKTVWSAVSNPVEMKHSFQVEGHPAQKLMAGCKVASTPTNAYHLIPSEALRQLADRFALGLERKGFKSWHAQSKNQEALLDTEWVLERIDHLINHALLLRDKLVSHDIEGLEKDNDASAIGWAGCFLICARQALLDNMKNSTPPQKEQEQKKPEWKHGQHLKHKIWAVGYIWDNFIKKIVYVNDSHVASPADDQNPENYYVI